MKLIKLADNKKSLTQFIDFPHELYRSDPLYVPEIFSAQYDLLTKHPFHRHSSLQCFLLYENDVIIGRIAAIHNTRYNALNNCAAGFFGFLDVIDDRESIMMLMDVVQQWLKHRGMTTLIGPVNFSTHESCGLLIDGFQYPPVVMMPYNYPYYQKLLEFLGFEKQTDLFAWRWEGQNYIDHVSNKLPALQSRLKKSNVTIRKIRLDDYEAEVHQLQDVYNQAWNSNTGFVPMDDAEFSHQAKELKLILDPDFCQVAECNGKIVGVGIAIPDINQVLRRIKNGRLLPFGFFQLLFRKQHTSGIRVLLLGVLSDYRKRGIEACLYGKIIEAYRRKGYQYAEASWTLEHNQLINQAISAVGGRHYKTYRIFKKSI